jgi:hypothetical protein
VAKDGGRRRGTLGGNGTRHGVASGTLHSGRLEVKASLEDGALAQWRCMVTRGCQRRVQRWQRQMARRAEVRSERKKKKGGALRWCTPLKVARGTGRGRRGGGNGGLERRVEMAGEAMGMGTAVATAVRRHSAWPGRLCSDREADWWAPRGFNFFPNLSKTGSTLKIQNGCLILLQKFPIFYAARVGYCKQFSQLCRHLIPNINRAKNPRSDSTSESLMNFKRGSNLLE